MIRGEFVELSPSELETVEAWAKEVTARAWERGYADRRGKFRTYEEDLANRVRALGAEVAVAKFTGLRWWNPRRQTGSDSPDVGTNIGVRWNPRRTLYVYESDPDEFELVLVQGGPPRYELLGKMPVKEAKVPRWWDEGLREPCYAVPAKELRRLVHTHGWSRDEADVWTCTGDFYGGPGCGIPFVGMTPQGWQGPREGEHEAAGRVDSGSRR